MSERIELSVRGLVEHVYKSGSIDYRFRTNSSMIEGTRIHQQLQKLYNELDQKEYPLQTDVEYNGLTYSIQGRADGLLFKEKDVIIDEIKSTARDLSEILEDTYPVHWAQAKFYAYIYAKDHELQSMLVQLSYVHVSSGEQKVFLQKHSFDQLQDFVHETIQQYSPYAEIQNNHLKVRNETAKLLTFPFGSYRKGQREMAGAVYQAIRDQQTLFAQAPTGIGKTISTLFPSVKAIGEGEISRVMYLTAKTITRTTAEEACSLMESKGLKMKSVTITAKDKICFKEKTICQKDYCEFADGYYDRINGALMDILSNETGMTRPVIEQYALKHRVCPFEFSLDLSYTVDLMICDYNYVFDPRVSLKRLFDEQKKKTALLVDEAHNLVDRGRSMFSADLTKSHFLQLGRLLKGKPQALIKSVKQINEDLLLTRKQNPDRSHVVFKEIDEELLIHLDTFITLAEVELAKGGEGEAENDLLDAYFEAQNFVRTAQYFDERYVVLTEIDRSEVVVRLFCLDPSHLLIQMGKGYKSKVYFSATLAPLDYYRDMLGGQQEDFVFSVPSPFSHELTEVSIEPISTRYRDRERSIAPIVKTIIGMATKKIGNYFVFFPSYTYLKHVYETFCAEAPEIRTVIQHSGMTEEEREAFLAAFVPQTSDSLVGFAVLGGIFSEGIDLRGDRLNGVVVVGVGLPQFGPERTVIKDYFDQVGRNGYDYSYTYPGMNKVLQAGGRLIRSETDKGSIILMDDRFLQAKYQQLLPLEWRDFKVIKK